MRRVLAGLVGGLSLVVTGKALACALPRPSAMASAKFANSTVNQSQRAIWNWNPKLAPCPVTSRTVVIAAATSVTNITGFLASVIGFSFLNESPIAGTIIA